MPLEATRSNPPGDKPDRIVYNHVLEKAGILAAGLIRHGQGHYRVKMALDSLGYRYGYILVWQMVAFYKQAHPAPQKEKRDPNPDERPKQATHPHQVWFVDVRYLVKIDGQWLYSILIFDDYSRAIVGDGCFDLFLRQEKGG